MARKQTPKETYIMQGEPPRGPSKYVLQFPDIPEPEKHPAYGTERWDPEAAQRQYISRHKAAARDAQQRLEAARYDFLKEMILLEDKTGQPKAKEYMEDQKRWLDEKEQWIKHDHPRKGAAITIALGGKE
jgi:ATP-dependent exoDNAse (exonuclease V) beta subunit